MAFVAHPGNGSPSPNVLVMARAPVAGRAKTRLEPLLGPAGCARLQAELVRTTAATAATVGPVFVACSGPQALLAPLVGPGAVLFDQVGDDLGARMAAAVAHVHRSRPAPVLVVGTDCPALGPGHLRAAADRLAGGADVVFGPAHDGGYYLAGLAAPTPAVFALPAGCWGGADVLARSLDAARGLAVALLAAEHDLDTPADAAVLRADPRVPAPVAELLR